MNEQPQSLPPAPTGGRPSRISLLSTGIAGFDEILGGGLPAGSLYLIQGLAGSGKTTLASQIGWAQARGGNQVMLLTLIASRMPRCSIT